MSTHRARLIYNPPPSSLPDSQGAPNLTIVDFCIHTQGPLDSTLLPLVRSSGHTFIHPPAPHFIHSGTPSCIHSHPYVPFLLHPGFSFPSPSPLCVPALGKPVLSTRGESGVCAPPTPHVSSVVSWPEVHPCCVSRLLCSALAESHALEEAEVTSD